MFLLDIATDMWADGWLGKSILLLMVIVIILIAILIFWFFYWAVDSWFVDKQDGFAKVIGRKHTAPHTTFIHITTGNVTTLQPVHHPESWSITLELIDGRKDSVSVGVNDYNEIKDGTKCRVQFKNGRLSGWLYITSWEVL